MPRIPTRNPAMAWVLLLLLPTGAFASGDPEGSVDPEQLKESVRRAALVTYFHGMTGEIAAREVGPAGVPVLLELLEDPDFPRRDNVVAFLTYLGGPEVTAALTGFLRTPPASADVPEEDRALLLAPQALGHIARRGDRRALRALLEMTAPGSEGGPLAFSVSAGWYPERMKNDLVEMAVRGLGLSGRPAARRRLAQITEDRVLPVLRERDLTRPAAQALELYDELRRQRSDQSEPSGAPAAAPASPAAGSLDVELGEAGSPPVGVLALDTSNRSHEFMLDYANHVDHTSPMNDNRLDLLLENASYRAATEDFSADVACCIKATRAGTAQSFGNQGDGLDVIGSAGELNAVLSDQTARFKVVRAINYCGRPGTNIIGCAWTPGDGIAVVRQSSNIDIEAILWIHEYGHNTGLWAVSHNPQSQFIGFASNNGSQNGLTQSECNSYHNPPGVTQMMNIDIGVCQDDDADSIVSSMDNCPNDFNPGQQDSDGNGIGDVCEASASPGLENISTRGLVQTGDGVMIAGFIIEGTGSKTVLIRGLGPTLSGMGVAGALQDPVLALLSGQTVLQANDDWQDSPDAAAISGTGLAPPDLSEAAILATLGPGQYTAIVSGVGGTTGVGLVEVYDVGGSANAQLSNISTRGVVQTGQDVLIGGFVIGGTQDKGVLIRALRAGGFNARTKRKKKDG